MDLDLDDVEIRGLREYVRLVARAVGLTEPSWLVQTGPPANAYIALEGRLPLFPTWDVALLWDEERGWALGLESMPAGDLVVLAYLCDDVLPAPEAVSTAVRDALANSAPGDQPPVNRRGLRRDDLPARLASYASPPPTFAPVQIRTHEQGYHADAS